MSTVVGLAWSQYSRASRGPGVDIKETGLWQPVHTYLGLAPDQALMLTLLGLVLGVILTIPWWRKRLKSESNWWAIRDEPLDTPPRAGV